MSPRFQKRHYEAVAAVLSSTRVNSVRGLSQWDMTLMAFIDTFKGDNPKFNVKKFLRKCGWPR